jgi:alkylated DNA repair dioxygenase AlkB
VVVALFDCDHLAEVSSKPEILRPALSHKAKAAAKEELRYVSGDKLGTHQDTINQDSFLYPYGNRSHQ